MRPLVDLSTIVLVVLALVLAAVAYLKDPGLPLIGAKNGFSMLKFILPRLVPALMLAGLMQVLIPQEVVSRHFGRAGGLRAILMATVAGVLTPGGPMVSVPFMVALAHSGAALPSLVAYMTSWSLFGIQRIIAWEAPLMGWRRLGGAADGLALRHRPRRPEPRLPRRGGLARRRLLPRVSAFRDLQELVARLEQTGRLRRVSVPVSRDLEITEITDRVSKGPADRNLALLFERVEGFDMPVLVNTFGAADRLAMALGVGHLDELGERVGKLLDVKLPGTFAERLRKLGTLFDLVKAGPRRVKEGPCQEVVETERPSLASLPVLRCWPKDGGRYITLPCVFTRDPRTGQRNVGMYRLQVFDDQTLGMHWQTHKGGAEHERVAQEARGSPDRMPVAIALGGDPAMIYAASAPLPPGVDEVVFAGWLRGSGVEMVACRTIDLEAPAHAEIVLEGYVDPRERRLEGPFGDHTGYYSLARDYPVFHLTAITRRARPIYPTTIVGRPPEEDYWLGKATERLFLPIIKLLLPEVVDINMPAEGVFHNLVIVSIKKRYPGHARKVMTALWGMGLMMLAKTIVVVSDRVNVHDLSEVAWRATGNIDPKRDLMILEGPMDDLDHAALRHRFGGKLGIDATEKSALDDIVQPWPEEIVMSDEIRELVTRRWKDYGL